ncbi:MAG: DUF2155 domain-containing protein [Hyphomicrobiales bacterium]
MSKKRSALIFAVSSLLPFQAVNAQTTIEGVIGQQIQTEQGTEEVPAGFVNGIATPPPPQKIVNDVAVFAGLDKITGRIIRFDVKVNETVQFGALQVTPKVCYTRPATETPQTTGFVKVSEEKLDRKIQDLFSGWMFAASPGLHAVDHAVYDVWLVDCKSADQFSLKPVTTSDDDLGGRGFGNDDSDSLETSGEPALAPPPTPTINPLRG